MKKQKITKKKACVNRRSMCSTIAGDLRRNRVRSIELEIVIISKVSQTDEDKYHMISLICGI